MRLLPSEQKKRVAEAIAQFEGKGIIEMREPCNCDGAIRHNNGGNYHEWNTYAKDEGRYFMRLDSTSEYSRPDWRETDQNNVLDRIRREAAAGFDF